MPRAAAQKEGAARMEQQGANDIIGSANNALNFTVLRRSVVAGHAETNSVGLEERAGSEIIELATVVALNSLDGGTKLRAHVGEKDGQGRKGVRLNTQRECP